MSLRTRRSNPGVSRRDLFRTGGLAAAGLASHSAAVAAPARMGGGPEVYTRIGVRPFINCTATYTINGGSQMLPEVIETIEQASHYHVNFDELMEKVGERLAQLLQVEWGMVSAGTAASLTHATAACIAGTDPEKMQRLPNLEGLKNEVIMPKESRNVYDHAVRTLGVKIIEVNSTEELQNAISHRTAMIEVLGNYFGTEKFGLKQVAPIANKAGIPILIDAAADYLIVPNPYIAMGADLVGYSGGKIIRGPQTAGLLVGRKDLVKAAWANSAPHHAFGRALKVSKEEIVGMLRAVGILVCAHQRADHARTRRAHAGQRPGPRRSFSDAEHRLGPAAGGSHSRRGRPHAAGWRAAHHDARGRRRLLLRAAPGGHEAGRVQNRGAAPVRRAAQRPQGQGKGASGASDGGCVRRLGGRSAVRSRLGQAQDLPHRQGEQHRRLAHRLGVPGGPQGQDRRRQSRVAQRAACGRPAPELYFPRNGFRRLDVRSAGSRRVRPRALDRETPQRGLRIASAAGPSPCGASGLPHRAWSSCSLRW